MILMVFSILLTFLMVGSLYYCIQKGYCEFKFRSIRNSLQKAITPPTGTESVLMIVFFVSMLLLPLFWGLAFFLKTDGNVIVVLIFMAWCYNWIKHIFFNETEG
ncbi:MAG: hypothetical protein IT569_03565 [Leptospiraceae bacterium]|nr:hypothetical protein [Leptospiraceae bacterium]